MKKFISGALALLLALNLCPCALAASSIATVAALVSAVKVSGDYVLDADLSIDRLAIGANITLDGASHTLFSANSSSNMGQATLYHASDSLASTFKNITLDGASQAKTDTCIWLGRGSWVWENVTVRNWQTKSSSRGAITLGKSSQSPGNLTVRGCLIEKNVAGLVFDGSVSTTAATIYEGSVINNTVDVKMPAGCGTLTLIDDASKGLKKIGTLSLAGGTLNVGGNSEIDTLTLSGGAFNITSDITSEGGISVIPSAFSDKTPIATLGANVDKAKILNSLHIHESVSEECFLEVSGNSLILRSGIPTEEFLPKAYFSWNFTSGTLYQTSKVPTTAATVVSWGDYRAAFMVFDLPSIPAVGEDETLSIRLFDTAMTFDNGRQASQAPTVTVKAFDGDSLYDIISAPSQSALETLRDSSVYVGAFDTLSSDYSSNLNIASFVSSAAASGKKYIGFYLTCRSEDNALSSGIVNMPSPRLSLKAVKNAPEALSLDDIAPFVMGIDETANVEVTLSPKKAIIKSALSDNPAVASVAINGTSIAVTSLAKGFSKITLTASFNEKEIQKSFFVTVREAESAEVADKVDIIKNSEPTSVLMDFSYPQNAHGYKQLARAVGDFRHDGALVDGAISAADIPMDDDTQKQAARLAAVGSGAAKLIYDASQSGGSAIIIGSIEDSAIIQSLMLSGQLDEAAQIKGLWEGYCIKALKNPMEGVENALVIAGSDIRGTIYGIYALSKAMGVSPWYWWSDVAVDTKADYVYDQPTVIDKGPSVHYRGIFINDEERLVDFSEVHFPSDTAMDGTKINGPNEYIYRHMFEVLLRLGANTLWPAMHEYTTPFNYNTTDDGISVNARAADEYGIVMSSSHCEILLRNNVGEWEPWYNANKTKYNIQGSSASAAYDYTLNKPAILAYWRERVEANREFESIFVLGIRGVHDGAPKYANLAGAGYGSGTAGIVAMQKDIITEQRKIIADVFGAEDGVPQVFIPYKEMNTYYNYNNCELASWLPDDIMIMYAEDNQGYLRQTTTAAERARSGGSGIYYHNSYWGVPKSYLWLNSIPPYLMYEEMRKAYDSGSRKYWILNVGDLKPGEINAELFMSMAWNIDTYSDKNMESDFYQKQAMRDYNLDESDARIYGEAWRKFSQYIQTKRPEFFGYGATGTSTVPGFSESRAFNFSINQHGDEGQRRVDEWNTLVDTLGDIWARMDEKYKDAFYEQIYYSVLSNRNRCEEYVYYHKNLAAAAQGRYASANVYAELSTAAQERIASDVEYFNIIHGGKWNKMLNPDHIIYYQNNQGILRVRSDMYKSTSPQAGVGAVCEGQSNVSDAVTLTFDSLADNARYIDVFGKNTVGEEWSATSEDWIKLSKSSGSVYTEERISVSIDWDALECGTHSGTITIYNKAGSAVAAFPVNANKSAIVLEEASYKEANGFAVLEAEHYSENASGADGSYWGFVNNLGQSGGSMKGYPDNAPKVEANITNDAATLTYNVYFETSGTFTGKLYRLPTLNEGSENGVARSCSIAVGIDNASPSILNGNRDTNGTWGDNVMRGYEPLSFSVKVDGAGYHQIKVYKIDANIAFDRIVIAAGGAAADNSLIGPPESPNNISYVQNQTLGSIPEAVANYLPRAYIEGLESVIVKSGSVSKKALTLPMGASLDLREQNPLVARVEYAGGFLVIYALDAGVSTVAVTLHADGFADSMQSFTVTVTPDGKAGAYKGGSEGVVIDTRDADKNTAFAYRAAGQNGSEWKKSVSGMQVLPNSGVNYLTPSSITNAPSMSFVVDFEEGGTYYVSANFSNPDDASDSFHCALDGNFAFSSNTANNRVVTQKEEWFSHSSWTINIAQKGAHTITIYPREDGVCVNQLCISKSLVADGVCGNLKTPCGGVELEGNALDEYYIFDTVLKKDDAQATIVSYSSESTPPDIYFAFYNSNGVMTGVSKFNKTFDFGKAQTLTAPSAIDSASVKVMVIGENLVPLALCKSASMQE